MSTVSSIVRNGRFGCPVCDDRFFTLGEKKTHIRTEHGRKS